jgi:hypothetical protein
MSRPTEKELKVALQKAAEMYEKNQDEYFVGKSLLNHNDRLNLLEHVLHAAKHYLHSGGGAREHGELLKVIKQAEESGSRPGDEPHRENHDIVL